MGTNITTYGLNNVAVVARNAQYAGTPFSDTVGGATYADPYLGVNRGASCAPGLGINTGDIDPKTEDWTLLDQDVAVRHPQETMHIGGNGLGDGNATPHPVEMIRGTDVNDTANFVTATNDAADGVECNAATGTVNETGAPVVIGDRLWGPVPVA